MKRLIFLIFLILPVCLHAKDAGPVVFLNEDSLRSGYYLEENWKFIMGDDPAFARPEFNDESWDVIGDPALWLHIRDNKKFKNFNGIGWFRLHLIIDSSIAQKHLALEMRHAGASEVYLDGRKVASFGSIKTKENTLHYNPNDMPVVITFQEPGSHVLAIRYANFNAQHFSKMYHEDDAGIEIYLTDANRGIQSYWASATTTMTLCMLFFGLFLALSMQHLFLYLYYRTSRSHLYFSLFTLSLGAAFLIPVLRDTTNDPLLQQQYKYSYFFIVGLGCFSLSGFINDLFSHVNTLTRKKNIGFIIISIGCVAMLTLAFINEELAMLAICILVGLCSLEAIIFVVAAIANKVKGARIIGAGILFTTVFLLVCIMALLIVHSVSLSSSTVAGKVFLLLLTGAILGIPLSMAIYLAWNYSSMNKTLEAQLSQVQQLSQKTLEQEQEKKRLLETRKDELEREVLQRTSELALRHEELKKAKKQSDDLLLNILPEEVADELKEKGTTEAKFFDHVSVLFTDFVNFTQAGEEMTPKELVDELHACFKAFDEIISKYGIEKIKTIGDAYLAVSGLPVADPQHAVKIASAAIEIRNFMEARKAQSGSKSFHVRIGIHSGAVVAGIVGVKKFAYDIWGDTVNTAARMEQSGEAGKVNISHTTYELVRDQFCCSYRGEIAAKNKGAMRMYFVEEQPCDADAVSAAGVNSNNDGLATVTTP